MLEEFIFFSLATLECILPATPIEHKEAKSVPSYNKQPLSTTAAELQKKAIECGCLILHHAEKQKLEKLSKKQLRS